MDRVKLLLEGLLTEGLTLGNINECCILLQQINEGDQNVVGEEAAEKSACIRVAC